MSATDYLWRTQADGKDYDILADAVGRIRGVHGLVAEIGTRLGGSAMLIMDCLLSGGDNWRTLLCIDPYGDMPYKAEEGNVVRLDYTNEMRDKALRNIHAYAYGKPINVALLVMEDTEFFARFGDGYPTYDGKKRIVNEYALVFFDGPHHLEPVRAEFRFFHPRAVPGAVFVFDDIDHYDHDALDAEILAAGYEVLRRGQSKASYRKVRV